MHATLRDHAAAFEAHSKAHALLLATTPPPAALATSLTTLAVDLLRSFRFDDSLTAIGQALALKLPKEARRVLLLLEAEVHGCSGDAFSGLLQMEEALKLAPAAGWRREEALRHYELLRRVRDGGNVPAQVNTALLRQQQTRLRELVGRGCSERQLPQECVPGLPARAWHEPLSYGSRLSRVVDALRSEAPALLAEYRQLRRGGKLIREQECIHDAGRGAAHAWLRYEITATWRPLLPSGCSADTPTACSLFRRMNASVPLMRAGYSVVQRGAWLRPHHGTTNAQLKLHLGLRVPGGNGSARCATLRVGSETRGWSEGGVIMFDDSFEHEVHNACDEDRVVFQVVVLHPALWREVETHAEVSQPSLQENDEL